MKIKNKIVLSLVLVLLLTLGFNAPVSAQQELFITIGKTATLVDNGQAVELRVRTVCAIAGVEVLEAFVYVTQNGNTSQFAPIPLSCSDQRRPEKAIVRVPALDFLFQEGEANVSAYVLVIDPVTGIDYSAGAAQAIRIR